MFDSKAHYVRNLFSNVPLEYDALLGLLTFGQDRRWRAFVVETASPDPDNLVLDVATGTGLLVADFARVVRGKGLVVGVDLTLSMLQTAKARLGMRGRGNKTAGVLARAEN
ncbi:MAG: class I SAM-dependent methyltransferase, partial [Thermoproteota archaeon]